MPYTIEQQLKTKERLKELRNENGITSTKMPSELREYMTSACLIDYEETNPDKEMRFSKTKGMSVERLVALADYYNVSVDYILGRTDTRSKDYEVRELAEYVGASTKVIEGIIKMYRKVPAADIIFDRMLNTRYSTLFLQSVLAHITTTVSYQQRIGVNAGDLDELYEKLRKQGLEYLLQSEEQLNDYSENISIQYFKKLLEFITEGECTYPEELLSTNAINIVDRCDMIDRLSKILKEDNAYETIEEIDITEGS